MESEVNRRAELERMLGPREDVEMSLAERAAAAGKSAASGTLLEATSVPNTGIADYTSGIVPSSTHYLVDTLVNDRAKVVGIRDTGADDSIISEPMVALLGCNGYAPQRSVCNVLGGTTEFLGTCERVKLDFGNGVVVHQDLKVARDDKMLFL